MSRCVPHPVLTVDAGNGGVVGLLDCVVLNRTGGKVTDHKKRAADDKESRRWLHGAEIAGDRLTQAAMITMVGDRESDIYDLFARRPANVHLLCRSAHPRAMTTGGLLPESCAALPEQGRETIEVPPKGSQKARQATVAVRFGAIELKRPVRAGTGDQASSVALWVVDVSEVDPPRGVEPLHWRLLTTHAVATLAEARQIITWYRMRWIIEQVFRSLKSHCLDIEASQMEEAAGFLKLAVVALIAAVRAMQLVLARDGTTGQPVTDAVAPAGYHGSETAQRHAGRSHREAQKPARRYAARLVRLDRRTTGRMVRLYLARIQAARTKDHASWAHPGRPDPARLAPGKSFRRAATP